MFFDQEELYFLKQIFDDNMNKDNLLIYLRNIKDDKQSDFLDNLIDKISNTDDYDFSRFILKELEDLQVDFD